MHTMKTSLVSAITPVLFAALLGCSRNNLPPNAHVQELGVLKLSASTRTLLPVAPDVSLYCVESRPDQLPQKIELFATVSNASDNTQTLNIDVVPTPSDYMRLGLKHLTVPFRSGKLYEVKVSQNEWIRFTPKLDI
jgi:hypothetical protein